MKLLILLTVSILSQCVYSGTNYVTGKIEGIMGSATDPALIIKNKLVPENCDGGSYGWLYFAGSAQEKQWLYSTALAMSLTGKIVSVYTNNDGSTCRIHNIQITSGLN